MATTTKAAAAKPVAAKAPRAAAATASPVATPVVDEAAAKAASSNQGSGDSDTATGTTGEPNTQGAGSAPATEEGGPAIADMLSDDKLAAAAHLADVFTPKGGSDEDEPETVAMLSRTLINETVSAHRLSRLGVIIGMGESLIIGFRDEAHQAACERHIEQIRELSGWPEGCGLHWGPDE
jgi:hypothetical protein